MPYTTQERPFRMLHVPRREHEAARDWAMRTLSYNIRSLRLLPGDVISLDLVADHLNISRTPIHEACLLLESQGLIEQSSRSKTVVSLIDMEQIRQSSFLICCIEPWVLSSIPPERKTVCRLAIERAAKRIRSARMRHEQATLLMEISEFVRAQLYTNAGLTHCWHMIQEASVAHRRAIMLALIFDEWTISPFAFELLCVSIDQSVTSSFGPGATIAALMRNHMHALELLEQHHPAYFIS